MTHFPSFKIAFISFFKPQLFHFKFDFTFFVFIINILYTFASLFGFIFVITAGGPGYETTTIDFLVYLRAFSSNNLGSGAALAVVLFIFIGLMTLLQNRVFKLQKDD